MSSKRIQVTLFILLLSGTASLYYRTFVTVNARISALESTLPPLTPEASRLEGEGSPDALEKVHREVASLFEMAIPQTPGIPEALHQIARQARAARIRGMSITTADPRPAEALGSGTPLFLWPIQVEFQSKYVQVAQFVHALQGLPRLTEVLKILMKRKPPGLEAELSLAVYSQTAPLPAEGKAKRKHQEIKSDETPEGEVDDFGEEPLAGEMESGDDASE